MPFTNMAAQMERGIPLSAVCPRYLHTNSTSHTGPFSAIAELIDNAYDPDVSAKEFWVDKTAVKGQDCLTFTDNGNGMDYDKMHKMLSFGFSNKQAVGDHVPVGLYGNGFKSGSMRLGKDAIVFTKKAGSMCVGLLSQTYLEAINAQNVIVPIVMFTTSGQTVSPAQEHAASLCDILKHSLFNTEDELMSEFSAINGPYGTNSTGTRIIIWNLRKTTSNKLEFDFAKDRYDIRIPVDINEGTKEPNKGPEHAMSAPECQYSLRAYSSILYLKPRMQIIIRGQKVKTQLISKSLANIIKDTYKPTFLRTGIKIIFGYNTKSKEHYGLMMYHKNRLIKAYERVACQRKANSTGVGVIGVIECNYLTPMHNKQDFENSEEYRKTVQSVSNKLEDYWKEVRHRRQKNQNCSIPPEEDVKRPDQNWVQCDKCLKWRKLPDGIDNALLPDKWFCQMNPDPQFRCCTVEEEPQDSDDEQPRYQKTYKKHERNQKLQKELDRQQMEQERISALAKEKADLLKQQRALVHQLQLGSPTRGTPSSSSKSTPQKYAGSRSPDNIPIITHVTSLAPTRQKRALGSSRENGEMKRARIRDHFDSNSPGSPSTYTASPEVCSSPVKVSPDGDGDQTAQKVDETVTRVDDDDIMIIECISSPRPKSTTGTFDITKVKLENVVSEEELVKQMKCGDSDTGVPMETTAAASPPPTPPHLPQLSSTDVTIGTQTQQIPSVKQEERDSEDKEKRMWRKDGKNNISHFGSDKDLPPVERNTNKELKSICEDTRAQQNSAPSQQEENQKRNKTGNSEKELHDWNVSDEISPGGQTSAKLKNSFLDVVEAQQQQDTLLDLLDGMAKERDESHSQLQHLHSQVDELRTQLLELKESMLKKEHSHNSTQTNPEEAQDYKLLYLQGKEEIKQLQDQLSEMKMEKEKEREKKDQEALFECDDDLACQIDSLLRQLDQSNKEREELKDKVDRLTNEKHTLSTCCETLKNDLEELKRESERVKVRAEGQEVHTDFPVSSDKESAATSAEASNSGSGRDSNTQLHDTENTSEIKQENNNPQTYSLRLRELRQRVARLLVTFVPALDLQQVNYDCDVIDEILTQVIDEITPTEAALT